MIIKAKIKTKAREEKVEKKDDIYYVFVKEVPQKGKANAAVIRLLANYFDISQSEIEIKSGHKSKLKLIQICLEK